MRRLRVRFPSGTQKVFLSRIAWERAYKRLNNDNNNINNNDNNNNIDNIDNDDNNND